MMNGNMAADQIDGVPSRLHPSQSHPNLNAMVRDFFTFFDKCVKVDGYKRGRYLCFVRIKG